MAQISDSLMAHRPRFVSFVRVRVADRSIAEDIVQMAYARVLEREDMPAEPDRALRWFYRVLLNAAADHHRRAAAAGRGLDRFTKDPTRAPVTAPRVVCGCVGRALHGLKPAYTEILQRVDIDGVPVATFAATAGISSGNAAVRLHRARRVLGERLRAFCGTCSLDGCADCDCAAAGRLSPAARIARPV